MTTKNITRVCGWTALLAFLAVDGAAQPPSLEATQNPSEVAVGNQEAARREVYRRMKSAVDLGQQARASTLDVSVRIDALLDALRTELADPSPDIYMDYDRSASQLVQWQLIDGLAATGDAHALRARIKDGDLVRVQDALAIAALMARDKQDDPDQAALIPRVMRILAAPADEFIGGMAATALEAAAPAHRGRRMAIVAALSSALDNPLHHRDKRPYSDSKERNVYWVRWMAGCALLRLGLDVDHDDEGKWRLKDKDPAILATWWVEARKSLITGGYQVVWDPSQKMLSGMRGNDEIRIWVGKKTARVNGKNMDLGVETRIVGITLMVPEQLLSSIKPSNSMG